MDNEKIEIKNISKTYTTKLSDSVVRNFNFSCRIGDIVSIIGPSGCGKSTLLKMLGNIIEPSSGSIFYNNQDISLLRKNHKIGWIPQFPTLLKNRTVEKNIKLPLEIIGYDNRDISSLLDKVGLKGDENKYPFELSGGMKQRVSFAQVMSYSPKLLLLDEPFSSLDEITREKMQLELLMLARQINPAIFFVTHSVEEAVFLANYIIIMDKSGTIFKIEIINKKIDFQDSFRNSQEFFKQVGNIKNILLN